MATTEHTINDAIANQLRTTRHAWRHPDVVRSENTRLFSGNNARPDILVTEQFVSPVTVETEVLPATTVEAEAKSRLGQILQNDGAMVRSSIAIRLPKELRETQGDELKKAITETHFFDMALYTGSKPEEATRWPEVGWVQGSLRDLSILIQSASIPPEVIDEAADHLELGISQTANLLEQAIKRFPGIVIQMTNLLHQEDHPQTRRMAAAIITNAFLFHNNLASSGGQLAGVRSFSQLELDGDLYSTLAYVKEWKKILQINYWPIFDIAVRLLALVPAIMSKQFMLRLVETANRLLESRLMRSHDLMGAVFQRLIVDRKFLAAYYTTPASASLLVGLALPYDKFPNNGSWANPDDVTNLRIGDFACGTGTLLSSTYQRVGQLHEMAGGDAEAIHPQMMTALVGCDVLPAATHLTASMLSGTHPNVKYTGSSILTLPYGKQKNSSVALGSLDLLDSQNTLKFLEITSKAIESTGATETQTKHALPHESFDMVIMNPPFTRDTNHERRIENTPNPMFAAFGADADTQRLMAQSTKKITKDTCYHGNAGEASIFLELGHRKLKPNGILALVMPMSLLSGVAWEKARALLAKHYTDLIIVTIADTQGKTMAFSADTGMAECLILGRKQDDKTNNLNGKKKRATFVILDQTPAYPMIGHAIAEQIHRLKASGNIRKLENDHMGGNILTIGNDHIGQVLEAPLPEIGGWNLARISDLSVAQTAYHLATSKRVWLPTQPEKDSFILSMTTISDIGQVGPYHLDVSKRNNDGSVRGPFELHPIQSGSIPTYPILWAHDAERERTLVFDADREGQIYQGRNNEEQETIAVKALRVLETASHCHSNLDFQFNSQSTAMQFTPRKTIGGNAWPSIQLPNVEQEKALVLWGNTTLGLLMFWWHANRQQSGRGRLTKTTLQTLPTLDVTTLTDDQLQAAVTLFDDIQNKPLMPLHQLDTDPVRAELDTRFFRDVLGMDAAVVASGGPMELLRMKLSREPSIRGSK